MGMDVYGKNPTSEEGKYFRNNVWWWRPLWGYCCQFAEDLIPTDVKTGGQMNDGAGLEDKQARNLGARLFKLIADGHTKNFAESYKKELDNLPDEDCEICGGTGKRLPPPEVGPGETPCNGCGATGKCRPWATEYPFSEENVQEFAKFCIASGGFEIC